MNRGRKRFGGIGIYERNEIGASIWFQKHVDVFYDKTPMRTIWFWFEARSGALEVDGDWGMIMIFDKKADIIILVVLRKDNHRGLHIKWGCQLEGIQENWPSINFLNELIIGGWIHWAGTETHRSIRTKKALDKISTNMVWIASVSSILHKFTSIVASKTRCRDQFYGNI